MADGARSAYAHARLMARHGRLPQPGDWRLLEAAGDFDHLLELVRGSAHAPLARALGADADLHALDRALRAGWRARCSEVARWYPLRWRPALEWLGWLPWLPLAEALARGEPAPAWLREDPVLGVAATREAPARAGALAGTPLAALGAEWDAGGGLDAGWRRAWRALWPAACTARERRLLATLDDALAAGAFAAPGAAPSLAGVLDVARGRLARLFRRAGAGPVAAAAWLALGAADLARLRACLVRARLATAREAA